MPDNPKDKIDPASSAIDPESIKTAKKMLFTAEEVAALIDEARREAKIEETGIWLKLAETTKALDDGAIQLDTIIKIATDRLTQLNNEKDTQDAR